MTYCPYMGDNTFLACHSVLNILSPLNTASCRAAQAGRVAANGKIYSARMIGFSILPYGV